MTEETINHFIMKGKEFNLEDDWPDDDPSDKRINPAVLLGEIKAGPDSYNALHMFARECAQSDIPEHIALRLLRDAYDGRPEGGRDHNWKCEVRDLEEIVSNAYHEAGEQGDREGTRPRGLPPEIVVKAGMRHRAADEGLAALQAANVEIYVRGKDLVRIGRIPQKDAQGATTMTPAVIPLNYAMLGRLLGKHAEWQKYNAKEERISIDPPKEVIEQVLAMSGQWPFPPLNGIINTPTMRPDGSLLTTAGYDAETGYFLFDPPSLPEINDRPTMDEASAALALLLSLYDEFPFVDAPSRSVAISMVLTAVLRPALGVVPMHAVSTPEAGTGKSYLSDIPSMIATGGRCGVWALSGPEETEKRLITAALSQQPIISLDNISHPLTGDFLCQMTERERLHIRPLSTNTDVQVVNSFCVFANGNNLTISGDNVRRSVMAELDAKMENPETRTFKHDPLAVVRANRGRYIAAALTITRAYIARGMPSRLKPLGSYGKWSDLVRSPLVWLGMADPTETTSRLRAADPKRQERIAVLDTWYRELPQKWLRAPVLAELAVEGGECLDHPDVFDALFAVAPGRGRTINTRRLGWWLRQNAGVIAGDYRLTLDESDKSRPKYRVEKV
jgi:putative DNA primase/helicase